MKIHQLLLRTLVLPLLLLMAIPLSAQDTDGDGAPDAFDNCPFIPNPGQLDIDSDGRGDACDNCVLVPNPDQANMDADGFGDECDNCPDVPNDQTNSDTDPFGDACDNCPLVSGVNQADDDLDGVGIICDNCPFDFNPDQSNFPDGDDIADACDNCPLVFNPTQFDPDGDGKGFGCDNCNAAANPDQTDTDGDGVGDACDNCPEDDNPGQDDGDTDFIGDVCDLCPITFSPGNLDFDNDGVGDECDLCPEIEGSAGLDDSDEDGRGDICDNCIFWPNLDQSDIDDDGVGDVCDNCPTVDQEMQTDDDEDTVGNECDNCPNDANQDQADADLDQKGDICDNCPDDYNPDQENTDGDPKGDDCDNCPTVTNLGQEDADGDDRGDICDNCPDDSNAGQTDTDGDAVGDACDLCPDDFNPDQGDADDDGVGDSCDNCEEAANTDQSDFDGDGEGDACDNCWFLSNPGQEDDDMDGYGNVCDLEGGGTCPENELSLELETNGDGDETYWEVVLQGTSTVVASGPVSPYGDNSNITELICLPDACYELRVHDGAGNGMLPGGYVLRDPSGKRIIDNDNDGDFTGLSQIALSLGFCIPLGPDALLPSHCDREDWLSSEFIVCLPNSDVSDEWGLGDQTDDGYQFWFFDPDGGFTRRAFRNHATSGGFGPPGPTRACHLKLSSLVSPSLPSNDLLNVRVRSRVNGLYGEFGPACRFKLLTAPPACPTTKLIVTPGPTFSCGATGKVVGAGGNTGKIFAQPVAGACSYKFSFHHAGEGYTRNIAAASYTLVLSPLWTPSPLLCGTFEYEVTVAVAMSPTCTTYCPFGPVCTVGITNSSTNCTLHFPGGGEQHSTVVRSVGLRIYPNPNRGDHLSVMLEGIPMEVMEVRIDIHDAFGRQVMREQITTGGGDLNHIMELNNSLSNGLYMVTVTAGERTYGRRLIIE